MINVLSCFDGISAGRLALQRANIEVGTYYRSEVDKYADKVAMHHFPNDIQLGDVTKWREWDLDWSSIDMLIGGSPCQGFSFAGKQAGTKAVLNGEDVLVTDRETYLDMKEKGAEFLSQSYLFWEYVLILDHIKAHNPDVKFLLENVKMKKELLEMIDTAMGVKSVVINSALLSAQNRVRHYWSNWEITQPEDKGILLKDILETGDTEEVLGGAIRGRYNEDGSTSQRLEVNDTGRTNALTTVQKDNVVVFRPCELTGNKPSKDGLHHITDATDINGHDILKRVYSEDGKAPTMSACTGGNREPKVFLVNENKRVAVITEDERGYRPHRGDIKSTGISELGRITKPDGKTDTVTSAHAPKVAINSDIRNLQYRKLTPTECARLQTFPDGWAESVVSNSQSYKAYGNSWTVDVIAHIFKCM